MQYKSKKAQEKDEESKSEICINIVLELHVFWVTGACLLWAYDFTLRGKSAPLPGFRGIQNVTFNYVPLCDVIPLIKDAALT